MKTQMKSDALLDAFETMELTSNEMEKIAGGGNVGFNYETPSGTVTHVYNGDTGDFVGYYWEDNWTPSATLMANNDHYLRLLIV